MTAHELEQHALQLPRLERERLVRRLVQSIDDQPLDDVDAAWIDKAERRLDDLLTGKVQGAPGEEVFTRIPDPDRRTARRRG